VGCSHDQRASKLWLHVLTTAAVCMFLPTALQSAPSEDRRKRKPVHVALVLGLDAGARAASAQQLQRAWSASTGCEIGTVDVVDDDGHRGCNGQASRSVRPYTHPSLCETLTLGLPL
jgi:hypothetical protein